jgi:hypothetical protein
MAPAWALQPCMTPAWPNDAINASDRDLTPRIKPKCGGRRLPITALYVPALKTGYSEVIEETNLC